jgi:hypothetical protein
VNIEKLKEAERDFLARYPYGFDDEELVKIGKKHGLSKNTVYVKEVCSEENLKKGNKVFKDVAKVVNKSSLVSVFEKMRFRDFVQDATIFEQSEYVSAVFELIHGKQKEGFYRLVNLLSTHKLDKWPIISIYRVYYYPKKDVFMKPTVVKKVIDKLDLDDLVYVSKPDYVLYRKYRKAINEMKKEVDKSLYPNNPAFTGFLMMTL